VPLAFGVIRLVRGPLGRHLSGRSFKPVRRKLAAFPGGSSADIAVSDHIVSRPLGVSHDCPAAPRSRNSVGAYSNKPVLGSFSGALALAFLRPGRHVEVGQPLRVRAEEEGNDSRGIAIAIAATWLRSPVPPLSSFRPLLLLLTPYPHN
jgi:hypothetical protein